ncbi:kunitz-type serine protease inhibitor [Drosophila mojavensis]|uniref:Uncharacterized protein, isoform B n=1 Tax=Drosophila mojavensis TaxID=7230 RepID=A0A0Q9XE87_DROMO|nr:kunitz-type serine protease inhibitor [Drosophila mojavensis]KRG03316.1 uncharacterized protein Dmoj_GI25663, isoform B [Drosophila mojavensis]
MKVLLLLLVICAALQVNCSKPKNPVCELAHSFNVDVYTSCLNSARRWSYNAATNTCIKFTYLGCGGNGNNFLTKSQCLRQCVRK